MMDYKCTCDARFSGIDEQEYINRGCPDCICSEFQDNYKDETNVIEFSIASEKSSLKKLIKYAMEKIKW